MAKGKTFQLKAADEEEANALARALAEYAYAAYPPGGSECAQVSRETLLTSAQEVANHAADSDGATLSRRQRVLLKAAVQWYFSADGPGEPGLCGAMLHKFP